MQRNGSFFMRGGSVVGAVLVVALLSAAAVMIDSVQLSIPALQVAGAAETEIIAADPADQKPSNESSKAQTSVQGITCVMGYDFAIYEEEDKTYVSCKHTRQCSSIRTPQVTTNNGGKTTSSPCPTTPEKYASKMTTTAARTDQCNAVLSLWKCKYYHCSEGYDRNGGCKLMGETEEGKTINSKEVIAKAAREVSDTDLSRFISSDEQRLEKVYSGESNFSGALKDAWEEKVEKNQVALRDAEAKERELQLLANRGACQPPCDLGAARKDVEEARARLALSEEELARLTLEQKRLDPQGYPEQPQSRGSDIPCLGYSSLEDCQRAGADKHLDPGTTFDDGNKKKDCGVFNHLCDNSNHPSERDRLVSACQGGNQQACNALFGGSGDYGAYGGYGARSSGGQSGCNSNSGMGGGGGIFGTIISLVMRGIGGGNNNNNGGCNNNGNNAPTPTCTITASPQNPPAGQAVTLTWQSERAFSASLSSSGNVAPSGSMTVNPQTTTTYTLQVNGYIDNRTGQQLRGQCATQVVVGGQGGGDGSPKAQISCRPEVADVGMSVAVSFACANSSVSAGNGFSTNNELSGSATPTIENPTIGTMNAIFGVTCSKEGKTDTAQCTVGINKTSIVLIANPRDLESGRQANIGWITGGMEECTISSPTLSGFTSENAGNTNPSGVAKTPALTEDAEFVLSCTTKAGGTKSAETTVNVTD